MDYITMEKQIQQEDVQPFYLLQGEEGYMIQDIQQKIIGKALAEEEREFNLSTFDMRETPVEIAVEEAETLPFFGERRVIVLKNCYFLTGAKEKEKVEHKIEALETYARKPNPTTVLILSAPYEKLDARKKVVKEIKKQAVVLEAAAAGEETMKKWMQQFNQAHQLTMSREVMDRFIVLAGKDLLMLAEEAKKLQLYTGSGEVTMETVDKLVPRSLEDNVFELVDAVVKGQAKTMLRIYYDLLKQGEEPIKILALLARQIRIIYHVKNLKQQGYSRKRMASSIKVHPYAVQLAEKPAAAFSHSYLQEALKLLSTTDYQMKAGKMDKQLALELCFMKLASGQKIGQ
ncbi:DNA polymerase III subunit delta [Marinococcus luteus]|uniref:DNA polymerase III subunit delta n=1 Tax=Marinococcus luteus TaxID=1122204 RepID=UPI002ACD3114|nr:DNA polymerase III subunit delta [Marinococcus luteus]